MSNPTTGLIDNYNLRFNWGTNQLEMNTGAEVWVAIPINTTEVALAHGKIFIGDTNGLAAARTMSGGATISDTGVVTLTLTPAGSDSWLQYNNSGAFGADGNLVWILGTARMGIRVSNPQASLHIAAGGLELDRSDLNVTSTGLGAANLNLTSNGGANGGNVVLTADTATNGGNIFLLGVGASKGQVGVGTSTPNASASVQIDSTARGFLPPRMTNTQRDAISAPAEGLTVYSTTDHALEFYNGTTWKQVATV